MKRLGLALVLGFALLVGLIVVWPTTEEDRQRRGLQLAVDECWREQAKRSLSPLEARMVALTCERLEADLKLLYQRGK